MDDDPGPSTSFKVEIVSDINEGRTGIEVPFGEIAFPDESTNSGSIYDTGKCYERLFSLTCFFTPNLHSLGYNGVILLRESQEGNDFMR